MNLIVSGPTATGKSSLAIRLAKELRGEIINLDSVQVYRGLDIGSGKLKIEEWEGIPHHLIDACDPGDAYNGARFVREAKEAASEIRGRGKLPILCGGTTLWLSLYIHGLAALPSADAELRRELSKLSDEEIVRRVESLDPDALERIGRKDRRRLERSIEASIKSDKTQSELYKEHSFLKVEEPSIILSLMLPRDELYRRIDLRSEMFFKNGIVEEAKELNKHYEGCAALKSLAYPEAVAVSQSKLSMNEAIRLTQQKTRRYAKRQVTFWRNEPGKRGWNVFPVEGEKGSALTDVGDASKPMLVYKWGFEELISNLREKNIKALSGVEVWRVDPSLLRV